MTRRAVLLALALGVFGLSACTSAPIVQLAPIPVPAGLSLEQVEVSILAALAKSPVPYELSGGPNIGDEAMSALFGSFRFESVRFEEPDWFPESRQPGLIHAGHEVRQHYLQVRIDYTTSDVRLTITDSANLDQHGTTIHRNANDWVRVLESRIARSLSLMASHQARRAATQ